MTTRSDTSNPAGRRRFDDLVSVMLAGNITSDEHGELDRLLQRHPEWIDDYLQMAGIQAGLLQLAREDAPRPASSRETSVRQWSMLLGDSVGWVPFRSLRRFAC